MLVASTSLADQALKDAFIEGRLAIDCLEIKLTRNGPGKPSVLACPGSMSATPETGIEARLVIARGADQPYDMFAAINEHFELRSGQLLPPSRYFKLEAKDVDGGSWINPSASVDIEERLDAFIVRVRCDWVRCETRVDGATSATHIIFLDELCFPDNVIHSMKVLERGKKSLKFSSIASAGEAAGMLVIVDGRVDRPGPRFGELFAVHQAASPLPDNFDDRLVEAVRFCTATVVAPVMRETVHKGKKVLEFARHRPLNNIGPATLAWPVVKADVELQRLSGRFGANRVRDAALSIDAVDDRQAIRAWVAARAGSPHTAKQYEREAERFLLWCVLERGVALSDASAEDCRAYMDFLGDVPERWISRRKVARLQPGWAPFKGSLKLDSQRLALEILASLFAWLVRARYLMADPWTLVNRKLADAAPSGSKTARIHRRPVSRNDFRQSGRSRRPAGECRHGGMQRGTGTVMRCRGHSRRRRGPRCTRIWSGNLRARRWSGCSGCACSSRAPGCARRSCCGPLGATWSSAEPGG
jgi:hypothetical protein